MLTCTHLCVLMKLASVLQHLLLLSPAQTPNAFTFDFCIQPSYQLLFGGWTNKEWWSQKKEALLIRFYLRFFTFISIKTHLKIDPTMDLFGLGLI